MPKIKNKEQLDGRLIEKDIESTKLEVFLGADGMGKYGTLNRAEYENRINSLNTAELRNHAITAGVIPITDHNRLKKQLLVTFDKYALSYKAPTKTKEEVLSTEKQKEGLKILSILK